MAAISRELGNALDSLREAIREAEESLATTPGSEDVSVRVHSLDGSDENHEAHLCFKQTERGEKVIGVEYFDQGTEETISFRSVADHPIAERMLIAELIPRLVEEAKDYESKLPAKVNAIALAIRNSLS